MNRRLQYKHKGFQKITDHYFEEFLRMNPVTATWLGEHKYDDLLPEPGVEAVEREISFLRSTRDAFRSLPERELTSDERLDRRLAVQHTELKLFLLEDLQRWRLGSDVSATVCRAILPLLLQDTRHLSERVESMISRLRAVPCFLMGSKNTFQNVPSEWCDSIIKSAERLPDLFNAVRTNIDGLVSPALAGEFIKAADTATDSIRGFIHWFSHAIAPQAHGDWRLGAGAFQTLFAVHNTGLEFADTDPVINTALHKSNELSETYARKITGSREIKASKVITEAFKQIRSKTPKNFDSILGSYRDAAAASREFSVNSGFASLTENESLEITETPAGLAEFIPHSAYLNPEFSDSRQKGSLLVTRNESAIRDGRFNYAGIADCMIYLGYPGRHLQMVALNNHPGKIRLVADTSFMLDGWTHYCEEEVRRAGFEASDYGRLIQSAGAVFHAARALAAVKLHQGEWNFSKGIAFLAEIADMDTESARMEMENAARNPIQALNQTIGKHVLNEIKNSVRKELGSDFRDSIFHDLVLYEGNVTLGLAAEFFPEFSKAMLSMNGNS